MSNPKKLEQEKEGCLVPNDFRQVGKDTEAKPPYLLPILLLPLPSPARDHLRPRRLSSYSQTRPKRPGFLSLVLDCVDYKFRK